MCVMVLAISDTMVQRGRVSRAAEQWSTGRETGQGREASMEAARVGAKREGSSEFERDSGREGDLEGLDLE